MIDVTSVMIDEKKEKVVITGVDLDSLWIFHDESDSDMECPTISYKFDTSLY